MALAAIGRPIVGNLTRALDHSEAPVRAGAAWVLGEIKDGSSVVRLLEKIRDPDEQVRSAIATALGKIRDPRAIPLLVTMVSDDKSEAARSGAEAALRKLTEVPLLIDGLRDPNTFVQDNSAYILWLMTAKEFRKDVGAWERWWREQQQSTASDASGIETPPDQSASDEDSPPAE
jgi:hypothetical protein